MNKKVENCLLCGCKDLSLILSLPKTPPANELVKKENILDNQEYFNLDLARCQYCGHFQLLDIIDPNILFKDYKYTSGVSKSFIRHFRNYALHIISMFDLDEKDLVVDIGSNDGSLLSQFQKLDISVLGVEPATNIAGYANNIGVETISAFFDASVAKYIVENYKKAKIITANNVFAHAANLKEILSGINLLLDSNGIFIFEVSHFYDMVKNNLFDMIYHEHIHYHTIKALNAFLKYNGFKLFNVEKVDTHGGSIRCFAAKEDTSFKINSSVNQMIEMENEIDSSLLDEFISKIESNKNKFKKIINEIKTNNQKIIGYGAPAKLTTLCYAFDLSSGDIDCIIDDSHWKQNMLTAGLKYPIVSFKEFEKIINEVDYIVVFAWNFKNQIIEKCKKYGFKGKFIIPLPEVEIVG